MFIPQLKLALLFSMLLLLLAACGGAAAPVSGPTSQMEHDMSSMEHSMEEMAADAPYEVLFIDSMIVHHQGAIDMAEQARREATKPEIQQMAEAIIEAQQTEIKQMKAWREAWYPGLPETAGMAMDMGPMAVANDATKPFDQRFIEAMIPHHEGAIAMARDAQSRAERQEIKALADEIISAQESEIVQMQQWLREWYGQ